MGKPTKKMLSKMSYVERLECAKSEAKRRLKKGATVRQRKHVFWTVYPVWLWPNFVHMDQEKMEILFLEMPEGE